MWPDDDDDRGGDDGTARKGTTVQAWTCSRRGKDRRGLGSALVDMAMKNRRTGWIDS